MKHIIRQVPDEACDFSYYFEDDGLTSAGGEYGCNLFIVAQSRGYKGFNEEEYGRVRERAERIIYGFSCESDAIDDGYYAYVSDKEFLEDYGIEYTDERCSLLKKWAKKADIDREEDIAEFLTITTGHDWAITSATGYCQGDYVKMVYCPEYYKDGVQHYGEIWLGAATEFCVIDLDDDGNEVDECYGFIVADSQAWRDEEYKRIVCEWAGIDPDETVLEMIDGCKVVREYSYRTA